MMYTLDLFGFFFNSTFCVSQFACKILYSNKCSVFFFFLSTTQEIYTSVMQNESEAEREVF